MKFVKFLLSGAVYGFILTKSEVISWYRWQEMFRFENFHVFGLIFISVAVGALGIALIKRFNIPDIYSRPIVIPDKKKSFYRYAIGGFIFGVGWAMAGCPGAHYAMIGHGYVMFALILLSAVLGTYVYGVLQRRLPH
jgi:hypothetical protein